MNKITRVVAAFVLGWTISNPTSSLAGAWDGIWVTDIDPSYYFMVRHNGPTIVLVSLYVEDSDYLYGEAFVGAMEGDNAVVNLPIFSSIDRYEVTIRFNRSAPNSATATVNVCSPAVMCLDFPAGTHLSVRRIF